MTGNGPYHIACTPIVEDALSEHNRLLEPAVTTSTSASPSPPAWKRLAPHAIAGILLVIALSPGNDIGYYHIMRWVVCGVFAYLAMESYSRKEMSWVWIWGITAGIYNPIMPVEATRVLWSLVNLVSIGLIAFDATRKVKAIDRIMRAVSGPAKKALEFLIRLTLAAALLIALFLIFVFVVSRWG
ncbi:MAG: DUF6804 family protein [Azonexus sp.]|nr:DUF6804 family protein [Azonexus sp.]